MFYWSATVHKQLWIKTNMLMTKKKWHVDLTTWQSSRKDSNEKTKNVKM